jgi:hypothetical protein
MTLGDYQFVSGAIMMIYVINSLFFLRFWKRTNERLFAYFSFSFALLGLERFVLAHFILPNESQPVIYLIRLLAFILIGVGILDKNRSMTQD